MVYLTFDEVVFIHEYAINEWGGQHGIKSTNLLESALHNPQQTFGGKDLYPKIYDKASILAYSLVKNHAFHDGNKRVAHYSMLLFLRRNGYNLSGGTIDEHEYLMYSIENDSITREQLSEWIYQRLDKI